MERGQGVGKAGEGLVTSVKTSSSAVHGRPANKNNKSVWTKGIAGVNAGARETF